MTKIKAFKRKDQKKNKIKRHVTTLFPSLPFISVTRGRIGIRERERERKKVQKVKKRKRI